MSKPHIGPVTAMKQELEHLKKDVAALKSDYLRSLAEFDNFRRRKEKEFADFRELANEKLLCEMVQVLDDFERALKELDNCKQPADSGIGGLKKGIGLIYGQLREKLGRFGFQDYSCLGQEFDPRRCEAVSFVETDEEPENTIMAETGKGYLYGNRVLRPALVVVARPKPKGVTDTLAQAEKVLVRLNPESEHADTRTS